MKLTSEQLIYFIGMRELEKEVLKAQLDQSQKIAEACKKELDKMVKEKALKTEKELVG